MVYDSIMGKEKITLGINVSFLRKPETGIGQVTANFLKKLAVSESENINFILYAEEDFSFGLNLSENFQKRFFLPRFYKRDDLLRRIIWEKFMLPKMVKKDKCDIFLSLYQSATILDGKIFHTMLVHDIIPKIFPVYLNNFRKIIYQKLVEKSIKSADKIVVISKRTEKDLIQFLNINPAKITVNYIGASEIYFKPISKEKNRQILEKYFLSSGYIFAGGGYEKRKNIEKLLYAYRFLLDKNKKIRFSAEIPPLVIYGKLLPEIFPLATDAEKIIKELNLTQEVKLIGKIPEEDLPALYVSAKMFVYPSLYEGFGLPVLEAMILGVPVIVSKKSSLPEVGGDSVIYCDPDDTQDIAMVMKNCLRNKDLRQEMSRRSAKRAKMFSMEKFCQKMLHVLLENTREQKKNKN
ncbi:MAG: hypothetical protein COZ85_01785 [Candidatus Moranbacteria bacterium CG_4_8_14_3_um_filter_34_16]|nr:MAG: hypothetical protein COT31_04185 [Candidatus Moranbacteria bacterium CG08_land_8_20_14_0_20_34_16]PIW95086.1 MAG: hypothetical protein COZ85_01785 [Candidatus Moranbacteria bacterium CG_4_8_14_3_um_filter_34_16]PJA89483.1 MAG: hypothetical protein CO138_00185 [Candidatus Moranbacteria bacterium CG_4_9_14_3_um_filter_33_15]